MSYNFNIYSINIYKILLSLILRLNLIAKTILKVDRLNGQVAVGYTRDLVRTLVSSLDNSVLNLSGLLSALLTVPPTLSHL